MTNRQYIIMVEQSMNLAALSAGGKFEMITVKDKAMADKKAVQELKNL